MSYLFTQLTQPLGERVCSARLLFLLESTVDEPSAATVVWYSHGNPSPTHLVKDPALCHVSREGPTFAT